MSRLTLAMFCALAVVAVAVPLALADDQVMVNSPGAVQSNSGVVVRGMDALPERASVVLQTADGEYVTIAVVLNDGTVNITPGYTAEDAVRRLVGLTRKPDGAWVRERGHVLPSMQIRPAK